MPFCGLPQQTYIILSVIDHHLMSRKQWCQVTPNLGERWSIAQHAFVNTMDFHRLWWNRFLLALYQIIEIGLSILIDQGNIDDLSILTKASGLCIKYQHQWTSERKEIIRPERARMTRLVYLQPGNLLQRIRGLICALAGVWSTQASSQSSYASTISFFQ